MDLVYALMMTIRRLYISPGHSYRGRFGGTASGSPIVSVPKITCVAGSGIVGDRYFDYKPNFKGQITFFAYENFLQMWDELSIPVDRRDLSATRRNVIIEGADLNAWIGTEFEVQGLRFFGTEESAPCRWMNQAIHPQAEAWMAGRGGLRARILTDGAMNLTDPDAAAPGEGGAIFPETQEMGHAKLDF